jgi:hypothetical protein
MRIDRILLVDHSSQGKSVDATKAILRDVMRAAAPHVPQINQRRYRQVPFALINVIDSRKTFKFLGVYLWVSGIKNPQTVRLDTVITASKNGQIDRLLGDEGHHFRNQVDYWPARFDTRTIDLWDADQVGWRNAERIRTQIRNHVEANNNNVLMSPSQLARN